MNELLNWNDDWLIFEMNVNELMTEKLLNWKRCGVNNQGELKNKNLLERGIGKNRKRKGKESEGDRRKKWGERRGAEGITGRGEFMMWMKPVEGKN